MGNENVYMKICQVDLFKFAKRPVFFSVEVNCVTFRRIVIHDLWKIDIVSGTQRPVYNHITGLKQTICCCN